jgi:general secretion pathway protein B
VSLILEALRRSERERTGRSGDGSTIAFGPGRPAPSHGDRRPYVLGLLAAILGLLVVGLAGLWLLGGEPLARNGASTGSKGPGAEPAVVPRPTEPAKGTEPASPPEVPANPPIEPTLPSSVSPQTVKAAPAANKSATVEKPELVSLAAQLEPEPEPVQPPPAPPAPSTEPEKAKPEMASLRSQLPAPAPQAPLPAASAKKDWPRLEELPFELQDSLPALDLQVHFYARNPERRFVLVNGRRFRAGEDLMSGLLLVEIVRDGMVLQWRGQRFLMPAARH